MRGRTASGPIAPKVFANAITWSKAEKSLKSWPWQIVGYEHIKGLFLSFQKINHDIGSTVQVWMHVERCSTITHMHIMHALTTPIKYISWCQSQYLQLMSERWSLFWLTQSATKTLLGNVFTEIPGQKIDTSQCMSERLSLHSRNFQRDTLNKNTILGTVLRILKTWYT